MSYYWLGSTMLKAGSVVMPGNWGRIIRQSPMHNWMPLELIYEEVRKRDYEQLPPRLDSAFVFKEINGALRLARQRTTDLLYEIDIIDESKPTTVVDMSIPEPRATMPELYRTAEMYWSSSLTTDHDLSEVLTLSPIRIIKSMPL